MEKQGDRKKPRSYFPRSFTMSKKYPGLGENISRVQGDGERRFDGGAEDQNKFPTAWKGEAGRAAAAPGGTSRIARGSRRAGFLFKFRFGASFTRISRTTNPVHRLDRKRCLPPWSNHSLRFKPSPNNPSRFCQGPAGGLRGSRKRGGGRGGVSRQGPELPETAGGGEVRGAALSSPPGFAPLSLLLQPFDLA